MAASISSPGGWVCALRARARPSASGSPGPAKLSISRPGDFLNHAKMLFLFAGSPPPPPPARGQTSTLCLPGVHRESLNPKSGDTIYLAPGAYFFGSLNLWKVENVKVLGRGTIVYEGPQDPNADEGWMQKPDWHCIGALRGAQRRDRRADLHRSLAHLVHPDEGFLRIYLRRSARDRRQSRQRQPGRHGLAGRRRHRGAQRLSPRLRR